MKVREMLGELGVSSEQVSLVPLECSYCGFDYEISSGLSKMYCPNPYCKGTLMVRVLDLVNQLGLVGFGESFVEQLVTESKLEFISEVLCLDFKDLSKYGFSSDFLPRVEEFAFAVQGIKPQLTLVRYVSSLNLPCVGVRANYVFKQFTSVSEFYEALQGCVSFENYANLFGVRETDIELITVLVDVFSVYQVDLLNYETSGGVYA